LFLAHSASDFYRQVETSIHGPAINFELDMPEILFEAKQFVVESKKLVVMTKLLCKPGAILVYQQLLEMHSRDPQGLAFVDG